MPIPDIFAQFPVLSSPRLVLRQIVPDDAEAIFATFSDAEAMQHYGETIHQAVADSQELIRQQQHWYAARAGIRWGITQRGADEVIGSCGFYKFDDEARHAETGYELRRAYWRQGIMREALSTILAFGFQTLGLHRVEAVVNAGNDASRGLLLALGLAHEGTLRERFWWDGRLWDEWYFGLLAREWATETGTGHG